jgi:hypothetical protein
MSASVTLSPFKIDMYDLDCRRRSRVGHLHWRFSGASLTEAHPIEAFSEQGTPVHAELLNILRELASPPVAPVARA